MRVYILISPEYPQKENRFIVKGWGVKLRVLGWIFWVYTQIKRGNWNPDIPSKIDGFQLPHFIWVFFCMINSFF